MKVSQEFIARIRETDAMQELMRSLDEEPANLLMRICSRFEETDRPVPDHSLRLVGYFGDLMLRVLVRAHYVDRVSGGRGALNAYQPTQDGLDVYRAMQRDEGG